MRELRDKLQEEYDNLSYDIQWSTFMLGKVAQLEAKLERTKQDLSDSSAQMVLDNDELQTLKQATEVLTSKKARTAASLIRGHTVKRDVAEYARILDNEDAL